MSALVSSYDPGPCEWPGTMSIEERVERGAIGIYQTVTGIRSPFVAARRWEEVAKPLTRERHRNEARACLIGAGWRS